MVWRVIPAQPPPSKAVFRVNWTTHNNSCSTIICFTYYILICADVWAVSYAERNIGSIYFNLIPHLQCQYTLGKCQCEKERCHGTKRLEWMLPLL